MHLSFEHTSRYQVGIGLYGLLPDASLSHYFLSIFWRICNRNNTLNFVSGLDSHHTIYKIIAFAWTVGNDVQRFALWFEMWNSSKMITILNVLAIQTALLLIPNLGGSPQSVSWSPLVFVPFLNVWSHSAFFLLMYGANDIFVQKSGWKFSNKMRPQCWTNHFGKIKSCRCCTAAPSQDEVCSSV